MTQFLVNLLIAKLQCKFGTKNIESNNIFLDITTEPIPVLNKIPTTILLEKNGSKWGRYESRMGRRRDNKAEMLKQYFSTTS